MEDTPLRVAIIDLGSNTARMIIMQAVPGYSFRLADEIREVVRLRQGLTPDGLSPEAEERAFSTLRLFKRFCDSAHIHVILATATSAVREAANGPAFVERVEREIGLTLQVLTGEREAYYGVIGALNEVPMNDGIVLDIGGGSAQLSQVTGSRVIASQSHTLGALALTDQFIRTDPATEAEVSAVQNHIQKTLNRIPWLAPAPNQGLIGLGGTIRNLARIEANRLNYPLYTLHGFSLNLSSVEKSIDQFRKLPLEKRQKIPGLQSDRADIILPGAIVLREVMRRTGLDAITISMSGLREGVFLEYFWQHLPYPIIPDAARFSVLNLARTYAYNKPHANHVRYLCGRLFDQLTPLHGLGQTERNLLEAAALLHDIGYIVGYDGHDRHSQTLIEYNGLAGFTPREIALIALLARYHRKGEPDIKPYELILKNSDRELLLRLAAILRLAEFLERGRTATVDDVILNWDANTLRMTLIADIHPMVEIWQAERNALPLVELAYHRKVILDSIAAPAGWNV